MTPDNLSWLIAFLLAGTWLLVVLLFGKKVHDYLERRNRTITFPLIRTHFPTLMANDLVSIQPMIGARKTFLFDMIQAEPINRISKEDNICQGF